MKPLFILVIVVRVSLAPAMAQQARTTLEAVHLIKLANSFRALNKPSQAISLLMRALPAVQRKNLYWEAVTYELLGLAHSEQDDRLVAIRYLKLAQDRYRRLKYEGSIWVLDEMLREVSGKNLYAGIQFGTSGAKLAIFQTKFINGFYEKEIKARIDMSTGTGKRERTGPKALLVCIDSARRYNITNERIFVAIGKEVSRHSAEMPGVNARLMLYNQLSGVLPKGVQLIDTARTPMREAELFTLGSVPRNVWPTTSALEISGGSTMAGYFDTNRKFHATIVPVGPALLVNRIEARHSLSVNAFREEARRVIQAIADTVLLPGFSTIDQGLKQRTTVGVGGDIAWALLTYLHPEKATTGAVPITPEEVARFKKLALTDYRALTHPDLKGITDLTVRNKAKKEVQTMRDLISEKQLIAGALWLDAVLRLYATPSVPGRVVFIRNSDVGWVMGKFLDNVNKEATSGLANGAVSAK